jgi:hypothetical protein
LGINLPATVSKLLVDNLSCRGLIKVDLLSGGFALLDDFLNIHWSCLGKPLRGVEARAESLAFSLGLLGELFPCGAVLSFLPGALLGGLPGEGIFFGRESGLLGR